MKRPLVRWIFVCLREEVVLLLLVIINCSNYKKNVPKIFYLLKCFGCFFFHLVRHVKNNFTIIVDNFNFFLSKTTGFSCDNNQSS